MLANFDTPIGWGELLKRTVKDTQRDNGLGLAAQLAYYFFLALFPALLFLIALTSFLPAENFVGRVVNLLQGTAPDDVIEIVRNQLVQIGRNPQGGLLTFGVVAALWSSSAAMVALIGALNRAFDVEDARPWLKQRTVAVLLTLGVATFMIVSLALVLAGPELAGYVSARVGYGAAFEWAWKILQWPLIFILVTTGIGLIYYFAPDVDQDFVWLTPGSLLATTLWLAGSLAFRYYVSSFGSYNESYGTIGGVMVLLLWLYLSGLAILIGAELNAEIEKASPHAQEAGPPGSRKTIGPRAVRTFRRQPAAREATGATAHLSERTDIMQHNNDDSLVDVLRTTIRDAQELLRSEIALARAELGQEIQRARTGVIALTAAAAAALIAVVFVLTAAAWAVPVLLGWPIWSGFALVGVVTAIAAALLLAMGRRRLNGQPHMRLTMKTMKENLKWMRTRSV